MKNKAVQGEQTVWRSLLNAMVQMDFERFVAGSLVVLMIATYRLWFRDSEFIPRIPSVPFLPPFLHSGPSWMVVAISTVVIVAAIVLFAGVSTRFTRLRVPTWMVLLFGLMSLFAMDQLTLQPWAYLTALFGVGFVCLGRQVSAYHRWIAISVYAFSGLGKLDYQFAHTVGQDFLSGISFGVMDRWPIESRAKIALLMPASEILVAMLLLIARTRRWGGYFAMGIHGTLMLLLGPLGLNHSLGVVFWNGILIVQAWFLFVKKPSEVPREETTIRPRRPVSWFAWMVLAIVVIGPLFERHGGWDHWLAWSLYAPHTSRATLEVYGPELDRSGFMGNELEGPPNDQQAYFSAPDSDGWRKLDLSAVVLRHRLVPIYPQGRYQAALIRHWVQRSDWGFGIRVTTSGVSDRWTGQRQSQRWMGRDEVLDKLSRF